MDFHLKQWRKQQDESEEEPSPKMPKLDLHLHSTHPSQPHIYSNASAPLSLFLPEPNAKISYLSALPDSTTAPPATAAFPRMMGSGSGFFSSAQWQELELQALIYRYMLAGAVIPPQLLQPINKSLLHSASPYYQPSLLQSGYWGRSAMDPEPGRCRRTDGKKWRCSKDVVAGQKYCERHVHRGRNRSRKPVEIPTPISSATNTSISTGGGGGGATSSSISPSLGTSFSFSGQSPSVDLLHLKNSSSDSKSEIRTLPLGGPRNEVAHRSDDGHILRHFFDDWPRSLQESDSERRNASGMNSATRLSISTPGNSSSDVSLKLATGNGGSEAAGSRGNEREQSQVNWTGGWGTNQVSSSMGGPLAEALRSSTSTSSPTSVLYQLPRGSASETSFVST